MKSIFVFAFALCIASFAHAMSIEDVVRLSKLKTGDELILQMIQKEGLDKKITSADVITLKEQGVSERVIDYMWMLSHPKSEPTTENIRSYSTTTREGKQVVMFTNLDEKGKRMGPEPPPRRQEPEYAEAQSAPVYQEPREIRIVVEQPQSTPQPQDYYVEDRYSTLYESYPYDYGYYPGYTPYYPYNSFYPSYPHRGKFGGDFHGGFPSGRHSKGGDASLGKPWQRPQHRSTTVRTAKSASSGMRTRK